MADVPDSSAQPPAAGSSELQGGAVGEARSSSGAATATVDDTFRALARAAAPLGRAGDGTAALVGQSFGSYRILRLIGAGGMGAVYEAEQERPRRTVALKVIQPGRAGADALRRFELESLALGRLQHPGIAQIFEAGVADTGFGPQPFFAMERVAGESLTRFAAARELNVRQRLELVAKICDAVQHAHSKGVIHRDLKPGNILVTADAEPRILDFGLARLTDLDVQNVSLQTQTGQIVGTLPYMSPEQVSGDPLEIDTRTDVYALGVILFELLAGRLPQDLAGRSLPDALRAIREEEPTRLSSVDRGLRGDLETIVGHALEKDRERRYATAAGLAADIRRYLADEPIAARQPSALYQIGKFARRNRILVAGVAATFAALAIGLVASGLALGRAWRAEARERGERERAEGEARAARAAEELAQKRADETEQVSDFQEKMLAQIDATTAGVRLTEDVNRRFAAALEKLGVPAEQRTTQADAFRQQWRHVNATDAAVALIDETILKPAVKAIDEQFTDQPLIGARLHQVLADRCRELGLYDVALPLQTSALETRRSLLGDEHPDTLTSISNMGSLLKARGKLAEAEPYHREALEKSRRVLGIEHSVTLASINNMGTLLQSQGKLAEAEPYYSEALEKRRRVLGEEHPQTLNVISNMGALLQAQGRLADAEPYHREALEKRRRVLGDEHPETLKSINNMGTLLQAQGRLAEAEPYYREALERSRRVLGDEHPDTLGSITNLGILLQQLGKLGEAEPYLREALQTKRRDLGEEHPDTLSAINSMGFLLHSQGKLAEAEPYYREALEKLRRVLGQEHTKTLISISNMGSLLKAQGKLAEAEPYHREALERLRSVLGDEHPDTLISIGNMGSLLKAQGKLAEAEPYYHEALEKSRRALGDAHPDTLTSINNMGVLLQDQGKLADAEPYYREALEKRRRVLGGKHALTLASISNMGSLLQAQGKLAEAEPFYREALEKGRRVLGDEHPRTLTSIINLGMLLQAQRRPAEAIDLLAPAEPTARKALTGANSTRLATLLRTLGRARASLGFDPERFSAAEANLLEAHSIFAQVPGRQETEARACAQDLIDLFDAWHAAEPAAGCDARAAEWRARLSELQPSTRSASGE